MNNKPFCLVIFYGFIIGLPQYDFVKTSIILIFLRGCRDHLLNFVKRNCVWHISICLFIYLINNISIFWLSLHICDDASECCKFQFVQYFGCILANFWPSLRRLFWQITLQQNYERYVVRQKRAEGKKALKDYLLYGKCSPHLQVSIYIWFIICMALSFLCLG